MAGHEFEQLAALLAEKRIGRRTFIRRATALGASASLIGTTLATQGGSARSAAAMVRRAQGTEPEVPTVPEVAVRYASLHAIDHTHIVIPVERNWHKDVGIEIEPDTYGTSAGADKIVSILTAGTVDISSGASVFALAGYNTNDTYISFGHGDIFQGFGFMVDPQQGYKSVDDFVGEGMEPPEAITATAEQFRGKRLATLNEAGIRGFITIALETAGMTLDDIEVDSFDTDSKIIAEMVSGRADFAVGSAPGRVSMTLQGFVPVLTSLHISQFAEPSPDSKELRAIFHDGWATTRDYWENNRDTVFRFMSMIYRTLRLMVDNPDETIPDHVAYYNSIAGATLTPEDVRVIYEELDPFVAYEDQGPWYDEEALATNPFHYCNVTGAHIKLWEEQDVLEPGDWTCENVSVALELWAEFKEREANAQVLIEEAEGMVTDATPRATELLDQARFYQEVYDFLDAERFAQAAIEWAAHETGS
jgi:ABC-type nitrate/sulfonate/bicarbonate transport system substrate-binding protein